MLASRLVVFRALLTLAHRVVCIDNNLGVHNPAHEHDTVVLSTRHQRACSASDSTVVHHASRVAAHRDGVQRHASGDLLRIRLVSVTSHCICRCEHIPLSLAPTLPLQYTRNLLCVSELIRKTFPLIFLRISAGINNTDVKSRVDEVSH